MNLSEKVFATPTVTGATVTVTPNSDGYGELPVHFKANKNGFYTITANLVNVEMKYLHLIDNLTGVDIDLLSPAGSPFAKGAGGFNDPASYTFNASVRDYESRFRLVFKANENDNENDNASFAYYDGSVWFIDNEGKATLQVVDMLGHILSNQTISGSTTFSTNHLAPGVYVMRLVNSESVKTQRVVVR